MTERPHCHLQAQKNRREVAAADDSTRLGQTQSLPCPSAKELKVRNNGDNDREKRRKALRLYAGHKTRMLVFDRDDIFHFVRALLFLELVGLLPDESLKRFDG
jgi:hypothetical protein